MDVKLPKELLSCFNFVDGLFQKGSGEKLAVTSPYSGKVISEFFASSSEDI